MINAVRGGLGGPRAGYAEMGLRKEMGLVREDMACIPTKWCLSPNLKNEERLNRSNRVFINSEWLYIGHWELVSLSGKVIFFALDCIICEPSYLDSFVHFFKWFFIFVEHIHLLKSWLVLWQMSYLVTVLKDVGKSLRVVKGPWLCRPWYLYPGYHKLRIRTSNLLPCWVRCPSYLLHCGILFGASQVAQW